MSEQGRNCLEVLGITSSITDQQQQAQIVSTYASAESSPNHSLSQTSQDLNKTLDSSSSSFASQKSENEKQNKLMQDLFNAINDQTNKSPTLIQSEANKTVKSLIEKTIKEQLLIEPLNGLSNNSNVAPSSSPSSSARPSTSSVFSLFQNIFSKSSSSNDKSKQQNSATNSPASSTSSPNPETSPFKLLMNEMATKSDEEKLRQSISAYSILSNSKASDLPTKTANDRENLEKLATLTKIEHEKCDPILSTSINSAEKAKSQLESHKETLVPSSSKEFCMNLNLKLASSVAQTTTAPVAILENRMEHNRFTSNASTSSIHNDLKIILEESKNSNSSNSSSSLNEQRKESPKPQRPARHTSTIQSTTTTVSVEEKPRVEKEMVQFGPQDGHYRYGKDFLMNIKEKKSSLIDNIYPDIFKAYCYCTSGKYWDPEKYFDIVQYPGEYDRAQKVEQNKQRNQMQNRQKRYANQPQHQQQHQQIQHRGPKTNYKQHQNDKKHISNTSLENTERRKSSAQADKILLSLIKKSSDKDSKSEENLLNMLQKPHQEHSDKKILQELLFSNKEVNVKSALTAHELEKAQLNDGLCKKTESQLPSPKVEVSANEIDLKNCSDAYQQLIKNLSNHPLSASPLINTHPMPTCDLIENSKENQQRINLNSNESANILKQMLKMSSIPNNEHLDMKNRQQKNYNNNRYNKHHLKYEQKYQKQTQPQQQQQQDTVILTQQSNNSLESLMSKLKMDSQNTQKEEQSKHFNSLLNKIMSPNPIKEEEKNKPDDILKWFNSSNKNSFKMVSEIERQLIMN
jgi:hypothetical protein